MKINLSSIKGVELDEHGNIKLPPILQKRKEENEILFKSGKAIKIEQIVNSYETPRECFIMIESFPTFRNPEKMEDLYKQATKIFEHFANLSFQKISANRFKVRITSGSRMCSWCNSFIKYLGSRLNVRVIKINECSFEYTKALK